MKPLQISPLGEWMDAKGLRIRDVARMLDIAESYVQQLKHNSQKAGPSRKLAKRIEEMTKGRIKMQSWD